MTTRISLAFLFLLTSFINFSQEIELLLPHPELVKPNDIIISHNEKFICLVDAGYNEIVFSLYSTHNNQLLCSDKIELEESDPGILDISINGDQLLIRDKNYSPIFVYHIISGNLEPFRANNKNLFKNIEQSFSKWERENYTITELDNILEIKYKDGEKREVSNKELKVCCTSDDFIRVSPDKKYFGHQKKGRISIYNLNDMSLVWTSLNESYFDFVLLDGGKIVCSSVNKSDDIGLHCYDFIKNKRIFSSTEAMFGSLNYYDQNSHLLIVGIGNPQKKNIDYVTSINLENAVFQLYNQEDYSFKTYNKLRKKLLDSLKIEHPEQYRYYETNNQPTLDANQMGRTYYNNDGSLKNKESPCQLDFGFFDFWFDLTDSTEFFKYQILTGLDNKATYQDASGDVPIFMMYQNKRSLLFWNGDKPSNEQDVSLLVSEKGGPIFMTPDHYYLADPFVLKFMQFKKGEKIFPLEQFDLKYNRPDIILDRLGYADSSLVNAYYKAYLKRLKKMGFTEDMLKDDYNIPEIEIENFEDMPSINDGGSIQLKLKMKDSKYPLDRINIWVNDVAIYGTDGISLRDKNVQEHSTDLEVFLAKGNNKVQVSVLNQAGAESYKEIFEIECTTGKERPDLYLIAIGESEFRQSDFNLTYASKDAQDMVKLFETNSFYSNVYSKTLINDQVTKENVFALSSFLEQADINDEVIFFIAGHGVLDANLDYYFATYDMDFMYPSERGLAYEDLESLLDGIKPLKKTLLIDACHSGEIDIDEVEIAEADIEEGDDVQFRVVGNTASPKLGVQNTSELTKSLFTDLRKGTGATVISSAGGMEFAMEGDEWKNGLFTYCLINGIKSKEADLNGDKEIWLSEIQQFVVQQVSELSGGRQQPTSRIENQTVDFRIW